MSHFPKHIVDAALAADSAKMSTIRSVRAMLARAIGLDVNEDMPANWREDDHREDRRILAEMLIVRGYPSAAAVVYSDDDASDAEIWSELIQSITIQSYVVALGGPRFTCEAA